MKGFGIYVQNDLLEAKHYQNIGNSLWLYLWLLDKITSISEVGIGKVLGGAPVKFERILKDLPITDKTYTRYIGKLVKSGYITALRTPYGYVFTILKAKKIFGNKRENRKGYESLKLERTVKLTGENRKVGVYKEDNTEDNTNTISESIDSRSLKANLENMPWDSRADDLEGIVDFDGDGSLKEEKKPQTRKYPNAPAVRKIFQEVLGRNPAGWNQHKTQLQSCENLYTEWGLESVRKALQFYKQSEGAEYLPIINTPHDLDSKWLKLAAFKIKNN